MNTAVLAALAVLLLILAVLLAYPVISAAETLLS